MVLLLFASVFVVNTGYFMLSVSGDIKEALLANRIAYFLLMISATIHSIKTKRVHSGVQAFIILIAVFVNICVWLVEQLVDLPFEFLSVSYIISELFLMGLYLMIQEQEKRINSTNPKDAVEASKPASRDVVQKSSDISDAYIECCKYLKENVSTLTATERKIYDFYLEGKSTKEILKELNITENTLKFHNKNIYTKLGVTSRKQIREYVEFYETKLKQTN